MWSVPLKQRRRGTKLCFGLVGWNLTDYVFQWGQWSVSRSHKRIHKWARRPRRRLARDWLHYPPDSSEDGRRRQRTVGKWIRRKRGPGVSRYPTCCPSYPHRHCSVACPARSDRNLTCPWQNEFWGCKELFCFEGPPQSRRHWRTGEPSILEHHPYRIVDRTKCTGVQSNQQLPEIGWRNLGFVAWLTSWWPASFTKIRDEQQVFDGVSINQYLILGFSGSISHERGLPDQHFVKDDANAPPIAELSISCTKEHFWCNVVWRAHQGMGQATLMLTSSSPLQRLQYRRMACNVRRSQRIAVTTNSIVATALVGPILSRIKRILPMLRFNKTVND